MIYTITPNPALDLGGVVDDLVPNEKMYVYEETRFPGGNGINAARVITALGVPVIATGFLGGGTGTEIRDLLAGEGVISRFIEIAGHTRMSVTVFNKRSRLQTRLSFPGPRIRKREISSLHSLLSRASAADLLVIGGSLPPGFQISSLIALLRFARIRSTPCVVDVPAKYLGAIARHGTLMIKPNLFEFQELVGRKVFTRTAVTRAARALTPRIPLVCVSSVEDGALLIGRHFAWFGKGPKVRVKSEVGAGDSMVGAMCAQLSKRDRGNAIEPAENAAYCGELLRWGLAAATAKLITPGTRLGTGKQIRGFLSKIELRRID